MIKPTPNPPETASTSPYASLDSRKLHEAAERALDHYLNPNTPPDTSKPGTLYRIAPEACTEDLLANACETLTSAKIMANDFAAFLQGPHRHTLLGIAQLIMLAELAVDRALDKLELPGPVTS